METISKTAVHRLDEKFLDVRDLSIKCSLVGLIPAGGEKWTQTAIQEFKDLVQKHTTFCITKQGEIVNKSLPVFLYATWEEFGGPTDPATRRHLLINKSLNDKGVALPAKGFTFEEKTDKIIQNDPFESKSETLSTKSETGTSKIDIKDWLPPSPFTDKKFRARVTYVDHDGYIYLHNEILDNNLKSLKQFLNKKFLATSPEIEHEWSPGQMCTVQYYLDKCYYRATVLKMLSLKEIQVKFIDYGNEETCAHQDLRSKFILDFIL